MNYLLPFGLLLDKLQQTSIIALFPMYNPGTSIHVCSNLTPQLISFLLTSMPPMTHRKVRNHIRKCEGLGPARGWGIANSELTLWWSSNVWTRSPVRTLMRLLVKGGIEGRQILCGLLHRSCDLCPQGFIEVKRVRSERGMVEDWSNKASRVLLLSLIKISILRVFNFH